LSTDKNVGVELRAGATLSIHDDDVRNEAEPILSEPPKTKGEAPTIMSADGIDTDDPVGNEADRLTLGSPERLPVFQPGPRTEPRLTPASTALPGADMPRVESAEVALPRHSVRAPGSA
jgi:hypothetical protein